MTEYVLNESELATFSDDSIRAEIRSRVAADRYSDEIIHILSPSGDILDMVSGAVSVDEDFGVVLTDEQLREKREAEQAKNAQIEYIENEIKPLVMQRLRVLARNEIREEIRETKNEVLILRASLARRDQEIAELKKKVST